MAKVFAYIGFWTAFVVSGIIVFLASVASPSFLSFVQYISSILPGPLAGNILAGGAITTLVFTVLLKTFDAPKPHLYREGAKAARTREFIRRYGPVKGRYVYGATVGKIKRLRATRHK